MSTAAKKPGTAVAKKDKTTAVGAPMNWRDELAKYATKTVKMEENTQTGNRIATKGGRLSYHDTPLKNNEMTVIILAALIENAFYEGPYDPDNPRSPVCFSFSEDGENMEPHEKSHDKQHENCDECPRNEWGSAEQGRGKACKNIRRIAVMPMEELNAEAIDNVEIAQLSIPVTSVKGYSAYVKELALNSNLPPFAWQTRIWLEPDAKSQFKVCFQAIDRKPISEKLLPAILKRVKEAEKMLEQPYIYIVPEDIPVKGKGAKKAPAKKGAAPAPAKSGKKKY